MILLCPILAPQVPNACGAVLNPPPFHIAPQPVSCRVQNVLCFFVRDCFGPENFYDLCCNPVPLFPVFLFVLIYHLSPITCSILHSSNSSSIFVFSPPPCNARFRSISLYAILFLQAPRQESSTSKRSCSQ